MRLFHLSEESNITKFVPRPSSDYWHGEAYVWAIREAKVQNYLLPRDCPRICLAAPEVDVLQAYLPQNVPRPSRAVIFIADDWRKRLGDWVLYRYEFDPTNFFERQRTAGYYVSKQTEIPIGQEEIRDLEGQLIDLGVLLLAKPFPILQEIRDLVEQGTKEYSIIRWNRFLTT